MKKMLLLFTVLLIGSLCAVESEPSDVVGVVKFECLANSNGNNNFIAMCLNDSYSTASELGTAYPSITSIRQWNPTTQTWIASDNYGGGFWYPDNTLNPNEPLYVAVNTSTNIYIVGSLNESPSYNLVSNSNGNLNAIMLPLDSAFTLSSQLGNDIGVCTSVRSWNKTTQAWDSCDNFGGNFWYPDNPVTAGNPYYVSVTSNITWPEDRALPVKDKILNNNK